MEFTEQQLTTGVQAHSAFLWATMSKVKLGSSEFSIKGHEYQHAMLEEDAPRQCSIKGAQLGITEVNVIKTMHGQIHGRYPQGSLYLFPTRDDVKDFSKARFDPLIANNPDSIGKFVQDTDAANIKKIGKSFLYLRGARATKSIGDKKSSSQLKSIPADRVVFDERDEMTDDMVDLAIERMSHSSIQEEIHLGTPTIPDYGIDKLYQESDQRVWMIKCGVCGKETCLELEFPNCLAELKDGRVIRLCVHCRRGVLNPANGRWVAQYPDRAKDMVGWWISQLVSTYIDPAKILRLYNNPPNGNLAEVMNSKLGRAYIAAENRLAQNDVFACCGRDAMDTRHEGPCAMGVDVGKELNIVIGTKPQDKTRKIVKAARVGSFNDAHDLAKRFNVKAAVFDLLPETRKVREFIKDANFPVYGCTYSDHQRDDYSFNHNSNIVTVNRNEVLDATHELVVTPGRFEIPAPCSEIREYAKQMCATAKVLSKDEDTGIHRYHYRKLGADHYRHATAYFEIASQLISTTALGRALQKYKLKKKKRTGTFMGA
ncbi:Bacteriophage tail assembly protein-like protein [Desulfatibacillum aliphaticivorans]|uniref:Bacteriophage tail assembly protein-like protein n=1 Tax=Desulfatibacillum aliphaticivorans TaxID=218208 RepID=B8FCS6_DESAL|nr:phage terminase large subunit family protein [Desulfatibacillum aliphaticivorans]ACL06239.1 Bacteriophage tail assembly protein-like protein [Desulfatibacillum aliphaticivorans]